MGSGNTFSQQFVAAGPYDEFFLNFDKAWALAMKQAYKFSGGGVGNVTNVYPGWLGSRVISMLDSVTEGPGSNRVVTLSGNSHNSLRQTVHTHCASVHQAAKLVAALLRVAGVTAGLADSNGSLPQGL